MPWLFDRNAVMISLISDFIICLLISTVMSATFCFHLFLNVLMLSNIWVKFLAATTITKVRQRT